MKSIGERTIVSGAGKGSRIGESVLVGVKLDAKSKELLTWALMKVARPGDVVIALHVFDSFSEFVRGTGNLLSLIQILDSLLSSYEGFCNLKQIDLKLKLCRGTSARTTIVREAKESCAAKVVIGGSSADHTILSWNSVARYCARKLPKNVSIFAVRNGKPQFQRETTLAVHPSNESSLCSHHSCKNRLENLSYSKTQECSPVKQVAQTLTINDSQQSCNGCTALQRYNVGSVSCFFNERHPKRKNAWSLLRHILLPRSQSPKRCYSDKKELVHSEEKRSIPCSDGRSLSRTINDSINSIMPSALWLSTSQHQREVLTTISQMYACRIFTYDDLVLATSNFKPENLVGQGATSYVYKGRIQDGKEIAVKMSKPFKDTLKEYLVEVEIVTTLHHKNIISLLGLCFKHDRLLLIYDFLPRGSLEENLHDFDGFNWEQRFKVALGIAEALNYLHFERNQPVLHKDVKSSNVLLSDDFEPQLSDFGFSSQISNLSSHTTSSDVAGTFGYIAPEFLMHGKISDKVDVYAFGVVLLEILSGRKAINHNSSNQESLVMWAKPILKSGKASELINPRISHIEDKCNIERLFLAAKVCLHYSPKHRLPINQVLRLLQGDDEIIESAKQETFEFSFHEQFNNDKLRRYLSLALRDADDISSCLSSKQFGNPFDDYLRSRCSSTSSAETSSQFGT